MAKSGCSLLQTIGSVGEAFQGAIDGMHGYKGSINSIEMG